MNRLFLTFSFLLLTSQTLSAQLIVPLVIKEDGKRKPPTESRIDIKGAAEGLGAVWFAGAEGLFRSTDGLVLEHALSSEEQQGIQLKDVVYTGRELLVLAQDGYVYRLNLSSNNLEKIEMARGLADRILSDGVSGRAFFQTGVNIVSYGGKGREARLFLSMSLLDIDGSGAAWSTDTDGGKIYRFKRSRFVDISAVDEKVSRLTRLIDSGESLFFIEDNNPFAFRIYLLGQDNRLQEVYDDNRYVLSGLKAIDGTLWTTISNNLYRLAYDESDSSLVRIKVRDIRNSGIIERAGDIVLVITTDGIFVSDIDEIDFRQTKEFQGHNAYFIKGVVESLDRFFLWGQDGAYRLQDRPMFIDHNISSFLGSWFLREDSIVIRELYYKDDSLKRPLDFHAFPARQERNDYLEAGCSWERMQDDASKEENGCSDECSGCKEQGSRVICEVPSIEWSVFVGACDDDGNRISALDAGSVWKITGIPYWVLVSILFIPTSVIVLSWAPMPLWLQHLWYGTLFVLFSLFPKVFRKFVFLTLTRMRRVLRGIYTGRWHRANAGSFSPARPTRYVARYLRSYRWVLLFHWIYRWLLDTYMATRSSLVALSAYIQRFASDSVTRSLCGNFRRFITNRFPEMKTLHPPSVQSILENISKGEGEEVELEDEIRSAGVTLEQIAYEVARHHTRDKWFWEAVPVLCHFEHLPDGDSLDLSKIVEETVVGTIDSALWFFNREFCKELLLQGKFVFFFYYDLKNKHALPAIRHFFENMSDEACLVLCEKS